MRRLIRTLGIDRSGTIKSRTQWSNHHGTACRVLIGPLDVLLESADEVDDHATTVVQPDVFVVCDPTKMTERNVRGAPVWIIEVLSPATARHNHLTKRSLYQHAGVREYWLVHPTDRVLTVYVLKDGLCGSPEIADMAGERAPMVFPEVVIRWAPIMDKLPMLNCPLILGGKQTRQTE